MKQNNYISQEFSVSFSYIFIIIVYILAI